MTIRQFAGDYRFLSNFDGPFPDGTTVEHRFQAAKTTDPAERAWVLAAPTPAGAKRRGRKVTLRPDWQQVKDGVMLEQVRAKFADPELAAALRATGDEELQEGNTWNDTYWGVSLKTGRGRNRLGRILEQVRAELR